MDLFKPSAPPIPGAAAASNLKTPTGANPPRQLQIYVHSVSRHATNESLQRTLDEWKNSLPQKYIHSVTPIPVEIGTLLLFMYSVEGS